MMQQRLEYISHQLVRTQLQEINYCQFCLAYFAIHLTLHGFITITLGQNQLDRKPSIEVSLSVSTNLTNYCAVEP